MLRPSYHHIQVNIYLHILPVLFGLDFFSLHLPNSFGGILHILQLFWGLLSDGVLNFGFCFFNIGKTWQSVVIVPPIWLYFLFFVCFVFRLEYSFSCCDKSVTTSLHPPSTSELNLANYIVGYVTCWVDFRAIIWKFV